MRTISQKELQDILAKHKKWLNDERGGAKAKLRHAYLLCANLGNVDLQYADLYDAYLRGAGLRDADLQYAYLREADLQYADLYDAYLRGADLRDADLQYADLREADLRGADLKYANLRGADLKGARRPWFLYIGAIGSRSAETICFVDYDNILCGCWNNYKGGTLAEFKKRIDEVYPADSENEEYQRYRLEYLLAIKMFEGMREVYLKSVEEAERQKCY